jgi:hypothetical protein
MLESLGEAEAAPRAFLRIGPASLARHQLSLALAMECQKVVCLARDLAPELVRLQHDCERAGARFHIVATAQALSGLITANDELVVIADGLLVPLDAASGLLEGPHAVLVQPIEAGLAAGFERIDLERATAGFMRIPGRLVERLHELPADCDAVSALTRIALQAGIAQRNLPAEARDGLRWKLVRNEAEAHAAEAGWIALHLEDGSSAAPGAGLARLGVRAFGPALLHAGSGGNMLAGGAFAGLLLGLGAGWAGLTILALVLWALAWVMRRMGGLLAAVECESMVLPASRWPREATFGWFHDAALVAILGWNTLVPGSVSPWYAYFAPLVLLCLLRLVARLIEGAGAAWLADRLLLGAILLLAAAFGWLGQAVPILAAALALFGAAVPLGPSRLTRA